MGAIVLAFYKICKQLMNLVFKKRNYNPIFIKEKGGDGEIILAAKVLWYYEVRDREVEIPANSFKQGC